MSQVPPTSVCLAWQSGFFTPPHPTPPRSDCLNDGMACLLTLFSRPSLAHGFICIRLIAAWFSAQWCSVSYGHDLWLLWMLCERWSLIAESISKDPWLLPTMGSLLDLLPLEHVLPLFTWSEGRTTCLKGEMRGVGVCVPKPMTFL